jgi:serine/threonine-protein kinase HipA
MASLNVWMNGELVGEWTTSRAGTPVFRYAETWTRAAHARVLSLSLPITADREIRGPRVDYYFDNLLPDNPDIRRRIRERYGLRSTGAFDLLEAIGRDCAGAVQLLPPGDLPTGWNRVDGTPLSVADVEQELLGVTAPVRLGAWSESGDNFRISIAGTQEKTALLRMGNTWYRPRNATPTTHILKLPLGIVGNFRGDFSNSVENEWLCSRFLRELGLPVVETELGRFRTQKALLLRRFDRRWVGVDARAVDLPRYAPKRSVWIARLPQEDFCQATGRPPTRRYEIDGGPSMAEILEILANSAAAERDRSNFVLVQLAFWLLAATDGHAKNFSLRHLGGGAFELTPFYDVLSAWPVIGRRANQLPLEDAKLAMAVLGRKRRYRLLEIQARHWQALGGQVGGPELWERMQAMVNSAAGAFDRIQVPRGFPADVLSKISAGVREQARRFASSVRLEAKGD